MASERKPSIYSDRSTIGSSDELDEYGVWVKSEPQDLSSASAESQESSEPSMPAIEELPDFDTDFGGESDLAGSGDEIPADGLGESPGEDSFALDEPLGIPDLDIPDIPEELGSPEAGGGEFGEADNLALEDFSIPDEPEKDPEISFAEGEFTEISLEDFLGATSDNFKEAGFAAAETAAEKNSGYRDAPAEEKNAAQPDLSTQLLMKIADELASIRTELATLKTEFSAIREEASADDRSDAQKKGFFDEEEDEKIALTGDELNNILNTADFTEEAGADATEELAGDFSMEAEEQSSSDSFQVIEESPPPDLLSGQEDIIGEEAADFPAGEAAGSPEGEPVEEKTAEGDDIDIELSLNQPDLEELEGESAGQGFPSREQAPSDTDSFDSPEFDIDLETPAGEDITAEESPDTPAEIPAELMDDSEELRQLREEGARPMTPAPEDTSYLDAESPETDSGEAVEELSLDEISLDEAVLDEAVLDEAALDEDSLDLSQAVIDEPDLSGEITENPLQEPALDDLALEDIEDIPEDISIDLDMEEEGADSSETGPAEDLTFPEIQEEELELSIPEEAADESAVADESGIADEIAVADETAMMEEPVIAEEPAVMEETAAPEEESFAQVIPEGFVVEADDSQVPFDDDPEEAAALAEGDIDALEKSGETGEEAEPEAGQGEAEDFLSEDEGLNIPSNIKEELKTVLSYMDQLLESLPEDKIEEFARSEYFDTYKKLFKELGLV